MFGTYGTTANRPGTLTWLNVQKIAYLLGPYALKVPQHRSRVWNRRGTF